MIRDAIARDLMFTPSSPVHVLWMLAAHDAQAGRLDWVNEHGDGRYDSTVVSAPVFTTDRGYETNGTSSYVSTGFNPGVALEPWHTQNSASFFIRNNVDNFSAASLAGWHDGAKGVTVNPRISVANESSFRMNQATAGITSTAPSTTSIGIYTMSREAASVSKLYRQRVLVNTNAEPSTALTTTDSYRLGCVNGSAFRIGQFSCAGVGSSMSLVQQQALHDWLAPYLAALGIV